MSIEIKKLIQNPYILFISFLDIPLSFISNLREFIANNKDNIGFLTNLKLTINMNYFEICLRLITVLFLFVLWKQFLKEKADSEKSRIHIATELTNNLNHLSKITHNKFVYLFLLMNSKELSPLEFADKLTEFNLSKDDLLEIGVPEDFINPMNDNLLSLEQMKKYIEFKKSLKTQND